jgi:hypothetical protein
MAKIGDLAASWACPYCQMNDIWGYVFECPGCGACRPKGIHFYLKSNAPKLTVEQIKLIGSDPNWYCEYCQSGNPSTKENCWQCGAEKDTSPTHRVTDYGDGPVPSTAKEAEAMAQHQDPYEVRPTFTTITSNPKRPTMRTTYQIPNQKPRPKVFSTLSARASEKLPTDNAEKIIKFSAIGIATIAGIALLSVLIYHFFFNTHEEMVQVSGYKWSQNVVVEEFMVVHDSNWSTHPNDAYNIVPDYRDTGRDEKIHDGYHTETKPDTCYKSEYVSKTCKTDNGDGSFTPYECGGNQEKSYSCTKEEKVEDYHYEDIYDWYYQYDVNRWQTIANYPTSGSDHSPYYFTDFTLSDSYVFGNPILGQQQEFQVPGEYTVIFFCQDNIKVGKEGYLIRQYPLEEWEIIQTNVDYPIKVNFFNTILTSPSP